MDEILYGTGLELLELVVSALGAVFFTMGGVFIEYSGFSNVAAGAMTVGAWEIGMGGLLLFVGVYLLGYQRCWVHLHQWLA